MKQSRRSFLKTLSALLGGTGLAALSGASTLRAQHASPAGQDPGTGTDWQAMDAHHQEGVQIFLDNIGKDPTFWGVTLDPTMDGDVKVYDLTCDEVQWEIQPGMPIAAMTYNKMVPGPIMRISEGDKVRMNFTNNMTQSTGVHFHGVHLPNAMDGVPFITQPPITPGGTFTYEFTAINYGSHMYHSHHNAAEQVTRGMLGAFIIDPLDKAREPQVDAEYVMVLNDSGLGFTINGKSFPYTQPIVARKGQKIRVRYYNEGLMIHPMHLHGIPQTVFAKDGYYLPAPYVVDTLNIAPGERYDVLIDCVYEGAWAYHCHILSHAESRDGMFGMVTALVVQP